MSQCAVQRCMQEATWPVKLKEPGEVSSTFISTEVCKPHRDMLYDKAVEWVLEIGPDPLKPRQHQQTLILGDDLQVFDEFVLKAPPTLKERPDLYSRIFSDNGEDGVHIDLHVRLRGRGESETLTIVVPPSMVNDLIHLLRGQKPT